ncbi:MAG: ribosome recycling factor [Rickettsiales bacterium]|jgi:ribosome recycling factor|nr:ribosome recycling factor [Rickettsiales bacterium]
MIFTETSELDMQDILNDTETMMQRALESLGKDLATVNAGRATPSLLDRVMVDCYGDRTPLSRVAAISVPDPLTLSLQIWDRSIVSNVEKAILAANLGFNPVVDGLSIRINIPKLSEERRRELCKLVRKYGEDRKVSIRNLRKDSLEKIKKIKSNFGEDLVRDFEKKVQNLTDKYAKTVDDMVSTREKNLMTV